MFQQGYKPNQIFKHFEDLKRDPTVPGKHKGVSKSKIYEIQRLFKDGRPLVKARRGRPPVPKSIQNGVIKQTERHHTRSSEDLQDQFGISRSSVCRIRKRYGYSYKHCIKIPRIPPRTAVAVKNERKMIARYFLKHANLMKKVVYSDETRIGLKPDNFLCWRSCHQDNSIKSVRRKMEDLENSQVFNQTGVYNETVMFWAMIGLNYKSDLLVCDDHMDHDSYVNMLRDNRVFKKYREFLRKEGKKRIIYFQQDNARPHTASAQILKRDFKLHLVRWSRYSCDMSPIEQLWSVLKKRIYVHKDQIKTRAI